jgi:hypothetical protein
MRERILIRYVIGTQPFIWIMLGAILEFVGMVKLDRSDSGSVPVPLVISGVCLIAIATLTVGRHLSRKDLLRSVAAERRNLEELSISLNKSVETAFQKRQTGSASGDNRN